MKEKNYFKINLDYDVNELNKIILSDKWRVYNQYNKKVNNLLELRINYGYNFINDISFLKNIPFVFDNHNVFFVKVLPYTDPIIHRDKSRKCALNIAISKSAKTEPLNFYDENKNLVEQVFYDSPMIVNVSNLHSLRNSTNEERIIFTISLFDSIDKLEKIYKNSYF